MGEFNPTKRVAVELKAIKRAQFYYNLKLWAMATAIFALPLALILWCIWEWL